MPQRSIWQPTDSGKTERRSAFAPQSSDPETGAMRRRDGKRDVLEQAGLYLLATTTILATLAG